VPRAGGPRSGPFANLQRMSELDAIRRGLAAYRPDLVARPGTRRAAVAMVLREGRDREAEVLLIERARRAGDPWSGHMAFPGGRVERGDASTRGAAERETREEVGVDLSRADVLGRLDDLERRHSGGPSGLVISGFVFHHPDPEPLVANEEVEAAFWVPLLGLADPERHVTRVFSGTGDVTLPGIVVGNPDRHVVWGLTYRFLEIFFRAVEQPFPDRWREALRARR
jgi:8-oxo-dGTP pyrophosphatase MutT (NUDIX family)